MPDIPTHVTMLVNDSAVTLNVYDMAVWVIVGLSAGFLASRLMLGHGLGPIRELIVGVIGGVLGNLAFQFFHVSITVVGVPILSQIIVAFFGALALVMVMRLVGMGRAHRDRGRFRESRFDRRSRPDRYDRYDDDRYDHDRYDRDRYEPDRYEAQPTDWRRTRG